mgnify:CR=1 FL=1
MAFIPSGTSSSMTIYFTQKGVEYLLGKRNSPEDLIIRYFTLGDSDVNYGVVNKLANGYVPDISGLSGTSVNITSSNDVKWKIVQ